MVWTPQGAFHPAPSSAPPRCRSSPLAAPTEERGHLGHCVYSSTLLRAPCGLARPENFQQSAQPSPNICVELSCEERSGAVRGERMGGGGSKVLCDRPPVSRLRRPLDSQSAWQDRAFPLPGPRAGLASRGGAQTCKGDPFLPPASKTVVFIKGQ